LPGGRKSPLPGLILVRSETTLKKQQMEGDRSSTWQRDREMTFGTMRRITAPTGTGNLPAARQRLD
jgi:hypothetical protein